MDKPLCQWIDNVGYKQVILYKNGKKYYKRVHRLMANAFIPNPLNLQQVNHINGNKIKNNLENLEWTTNSINTQHGYDNNLYHSKKRSVKIKAINKKTKEEIVFKSIRETSNILGLNRKTISNILNGNKKINNYDYLFEYL